MVGNFDKDIQKFVIPILVSYLITAARVLVENKGQVLSLFPDAKTVMESAEDTIREYKNKIRNEIS